MKSAHRNRPFCVPKAMVEEKKNLEDELRGALTEAKESLKGRRKLNTLVNLINELKALETKAK